MAVVWYIVNRSLSEYAPYVLKITLKVKIIIQQKYWRQSRFLYPVFEMPGVFLNIQPTWYKVNTLSSVSSLVIIHFFPFTSYFKSIYAFIFLVSEFVVSILPRQGLNILRLTRLEEIEAEKVYVFQPTVRNRFVQITTLQATMQFTGTISISYTYLDLVFRKKH